MTKPRIYLDHAATTPIRPEAKAAMLEGLERWANPSSPHAEGRAARATLEDARERIKRALGWTGELIFTGGASEAIEIAMRRAKGGQRFISAVEHDAVLRAAPDATTIPVGQDHEVDQDWLTRSLRTAMRPVVAVQDVNSETGQRQPVDEVTQIVRAAGGTLVADCAQSAGKFALPDADMLIVSAHKMGGPPGIGALLVRDLSWLEAGGGQERGYRAGTENLPAILGFAAALPASACMPEETLLSLSNGAIAGEILAAGGRQVGFRHGSASIAAWAMPYLSARAQLVQFDLAGFAVSAGSACSSGSLKPSRTLTAFGIAEDVAERTIRVSFGWTTTPDDLAAFEAAWLEIARAARRRAA